MSLLTRFSHIYVESELLDHPQAKKILSRFPQAHVIEIRRFTDVFNRPRQNYTRQYEAQSLILAERHGTLIYPGAPVCQNFGRSRFFHTSTAVGCLFNCEYCWLKGIYASAAVVVFLNTKDYFSELEALLKDGPVYLSLTYETDLFPLEELTGHLHAWTDFARSHPDLLLEVRTKSNRKDLLPMFQNCPNLILAWTLSPEEVIRAYEHGTPSLTKRLGAVNAAIELGLRVRLCLDPLIRMPDWKRIYHDMIQTISESTDLSRIQDCSIGSYRQSEAYQRKMKKRFPSSAVIQYPYETIDGYCMYRDHLFIDAWMKQQLSAVMEESKIFSLEENL